MRVTNYHMIKVYGNTHVVSVLGHMPSKPTEFKAMSGAFWAVCRSTSLGTLGEGLRIQDDSY